MFIEALLLSQTFVTGPLAWALLSLLLISLFVFLISTRIKRLRSLHRDERGAASALDFVFVLPIGMLFISLIVQFLNLAQQSIVLHHAAFKAARSALVNKCSPPSIQRLGFEEVFTSFACDFGEGEALIERAAQIGAIPAAPASSYVRHRFDCASDRVQTLTDSMIPMAVGYGAPPTLARAMENRICYVVEPGNLNVSSSWLVTGYLTEGLPPVEVTLTYRHPLTAPIGNWLLATDGGRRNDGTRWREGTASVILR